MHPIDLGTVDSDLAGILEVAQRHDEDADRPIGAIFLAFYGIGRARTTVSLFLSHHDSCIVNCVQVTLLVGEKASVMCGGKKVKIMMVAEVALVKENSYRIILEADQ